MTLSFNTMRTPTQTPRVLIQPVDLAYATGADHLVKTMKQLPETRRIAKLRAEGESIRTIAYQTGKSKRQVFRRLRNLSDYEKKYDELVDQYKQYKKPRPRVIKYAPRLYFNACIRCGGTVRLDWDVLLHVNAMDCLSCAWNFHPTGLGLVRRDKLAVGT